LLIGMDLDSPDMTKNSRADAMMIVSLDRANRRMTLASVMRDQYCYIPKTGKFEKLHHANAYGGPGAQIAVIEQYYKVGIDNYAVVNFYSLPKIIDALGGITVDITPQEAEFLNSTCGFNVEPGENHLPGQEILVYMRIRRGNTGGDEGRVMRQQQVFKQILARLRTVEKTALPALIDQLMPYVRTGYTPAALLSLAGEALTNDWFGFDIQQVSLPDHECADEATINGVWYWKVDFPPAARKLQTALYGRTNIELEDDRESWLTQ
ncbi:MAG: LCP family protein, partial [Clostridia bacterium]|nr:LCP family protein [Clostridia bacterium]